MKQAFLLLPLSAVLAACAPTQTGASALTPVVLNTHAAVFTLRPGETRYVQLTYPRSVINVNNKYFDDLKIDFGSVNGGNVNSVSAHAGWLRMTPAHLPAGLQVSLDRASVVKDVVKTTNDRLQTVVTYFQYVQVVLKITAGPAAAPTEEVVAELRFHDGVTKSPVPFALAVKN